MKKKKKKKKGEERKKERKENYNLRNVRLSFIRRLYDTHTCLLLQLQSSVITSARGKTLRHHDGWTGATSPSKSLRPRIGIARRWTGARQIGGDLFQGEGLESTGALGTRYRRDVREHRDEASGAHRRAYREKTRDASIFRRSHVVLRPRQNRGESATGEGNSGAGLIFGSLNLINRLFD